MLKSLVDLDIEGLLQTEEMPKNEAYRATIMTPDGPKEVPVPFPCSKCPQPSTYGKNQKWFCPEHWVESGLWR